MKRATKAVAHAKFKTARIVMDLTAGRIEVIIGEPANDLRGHENPWDKV